MSSVMLSAPAVNTLPALAFCAVKLAPDATMTLTASRSTAIVTSTWNRRWPKRTLKRFMSSSVFASLA